MLIDRRPILAMLALVGTFAVFGASGAMTVRKRLLKAIKVTHELHRKAEAAQPAQLRSAAPQPIVREDRNNTVLKRFLRRRQVKQYDTSRPWYRHYPHSRGSWQHAAQSVWPMKDDAPALRVLLEDKDPSIRALAAESLGTLHLPEDVEAIASLLCDKNECLPVLGSNNQMTSLMIPVPVGDHLELMRSWHAREVRTYAQQALKLMTGKLFTQESFREWWHHNKNAHHSLWYWQQRLQREMAAEAKRIVLLKELSQLPPEVEAKVYLLATNKHAGGADITKPRTAFFPMPLTAMRLDAERLLSLMDRKDLWADVDWTDRSNYNRMVERIALSASTFFRAKHAERLKLVLAREEKSDSLWWSTRAALVIGISGLLPITKENSGKPDNRDGYLRSAIADHTDPFVRGYVARELVRVGVKENWIFLRAAFFAEQDNSHVPDLRASILEALGRKPLTLEKKVALVELLLDKRFVPLWTKTRGSGHHRLYAAQAVNKHAAREAITHKHLQDLRDPERQDTALKIVLETVAEFSRLKK